MSGVDAQRVVSSFGSAAEIDFATSTGLQKLLHVVRHTPLERESYNELRDLIFSYKQQGNSPEIKDQIIRTLTDVGVIAASADTPVVPEEHEDAAVNTVPVTVTNEEPASQAMPEPIVPTETPEAKSGFTPQPVTQNKLGLSRPRPAFGATPAVKPVADTSTPEKVTTPPAPEATTSEQKSEPAPEPISEVTSEPAPEPVNEEVPEVTPTQVPAPDVDPNNPTLTTEEAVPTTSDTTDGQVTYTDPMERIKEIKKAVNEKVGNPINLIDSNNEIGREYMNALLDSMKKVSGGTSDEVNAAMVRLENAYTAVEVMLKDKMKPQKIKEVEPATPPQTSEVEPAEDAQQQTSNPTINTPSGPAATPGAKSKPEIKVIHEGTHTSEDEQFNMKDEEVPPPVIEIESHDVSREDGDPQLPKSLLFAKESEEQVPEPASLGTPPPPNPEPTPEPKAPVIPDVKPDIKTEPVAPAPQPPPATPNTGSGFASVAQQKEIQDAEQAKVQAASDALAAQEAHKNANDPLNSAEVTNGLHQLLSEWKLFKSSGIFGTGPSGVEHPLYKKIANMQMSAVVAGRFEGATPEIKQSISEYMNGWRYEEGILHQHGETFERYLRRVIHKILEKQKAAVTS